MERLLRLLTLLGVNAVPGVGIFLAGWSSSTALAVYWWENFFGSLLIAIRIVTHQKLTRKRGYDLDSINSSATTDEGQPRAQISFLADFLSTMLLFTCAHGYFLAVIIFLIFRQELGPREALDVTELKEGIVGMTGFLVLGLCVDLVGIRERPFAWIQQMRDVALGRMLVVHFTIIFGGFAMAYFNQPRAFFGVFIVSKLLLELAWWMPRREWAMPENPSAWGRAFASRLGREEEFVKGWKVQVAREREKDTSSELPVDEASRAGSDDSKNTRKPVKN